MLLKLVPTDECCEFKLSNLHMTKYFKKQIQNKELLEFSEIFVGLDKKKSYVSLQILQSGNPRAFLIYTPCKLGKKSVYRLIHQTAVSWWWPSG